MHCHVLHFVRVQLHSNPANYLCECTNSLDRVWLRLTIPRLTLWWQRTIAVSRCRALPIYGLRASSHMAHPLIFHNLLCEGPQTLIFVAAPPPPPEHPKSCNMYCYCRCRCLCFCGVVVELHTRCICVCVELKCYSGASRSNRGGNELGKGGVFSNRGYYAHVS